MMPRSGSLASTKVNFFAVLCVWLLLIVASLLPVAFVSAASVFCPLGMCTLSLRCGLLGCIHVFLPAGNILSMKDAIARGKM
jgi:hypothetical protein